ncbi:Altered inheritance of mitochondria protein 6 [Neocucurbitaria cava]|uniref:Altered inheritance of mitochondria protein 6 n=1 Tax=Neocucurbitaria cava TaxID=798079 RepID=A0A9W8YGR8_9PLEO|nr:Altered inheritance of mitochondria protein 6 [Neocucurbitaria cava]
MEQKDENSKSKSQIVVAVRPVYPRMLSGDGRPRKFRDDEDETSSQASSAISLEEGNINRRKPKCVYISFVTTLIRRLAPPPGHSGLQHIVETWKEPDSNGAFKFDWRDDISRDIVPKNCHSHNDYWRRVPLYEALAAGCVSIEADVWLTEDKELLVSHSWQSTTKERTLRSLYLDPLTNIFENRNVSAASTDDKQTGMFDSDPNTSTILLIDFKTDGHELWPVVLSQLQPFRDKNWLTYYDGEKLIQGPLTIVGTGNTPFDLVQQNSTDRFIFFDAPLLSLSSSSDGDKYNTTNSYYASTNMKAAIGRIWPHTTHKLSSKQVDTIQSQIKAAEDKGLKSRYWDTPPWPIALRDNVWSTLMDAGVGMLNVDDLVSASRWNWGWCVVAGIALCGNS